MLQFFTPSNLSWWGSNGPSSLKKKRLFLVLLQTDNTVNLIVDLYLKTRPIYCSSHSVSNNSFATLEYSLLYYIKKVQLYLEGQYYAFLQRQDRLYIWDIAEMARSVKHNRRNVTDVKLWACSLERFLNLQVDPEERLLSCIKWSVGFSVFGMWPSTVALQFLTFFRFVSCKLYRNWIPSH